MRRTILPPKYFNHYWLCSASCVARPETSDGT